MVKKTKKIRVSEHVKTLKKRNKVAGKRIVKRKASTKKDRRTKAYIEWRKAVYERDEHTCKRCGRKNCYLNAHHIRPWALFPEDRYKVENGVTLCVKCHGQVHRSKVSKFLDLGYGRNKPIPSGRGRKVRRQRTVT